MRLIVDLETDGLLPQLTKIHCIVAKDIDSNEVYAFYGNSIPLGIDLLESADELIAHNGIGFDIPALKKVYPEFKAKKVTDTLVLSRLIHADLTNEDHARNWSDDHNLPKKSYGSHSLKAWGIRLAKHKGDFDGGDWKAFSMKMLEYCKQDVEVTHELYNHLKPDDWSVRARQLEHDLAEICERIGGAGWSFDRGKAGALYASLSKERLDLEAELKTLFEPWEERTLFTPKVNNSKLGYVKGMPTTKVKVIEFNPNSRAHIQHCLVSKYGWKPTDWTPSGQAKIDEGILSHLPYPEAKKLAKMFLLNKRIGQLAEGNQAWMRMVHVDGKLRHSIIPNGTVTGRASHRYPNLAQVPATRALYGKECRQLFGVPPGYKLVGGDLAGLELRMLGHYLSQFDDGEYAKQIIDGDIHTFNQKAVGLETRDQAKTYAYAMIYGAGATRLGSIVGGGVKEGQRLKKRFFEAVPAFKKLTDKTVSEADNYGYLIGLDGRRIKVRSPHAALNTLLQGAGAVVCKQWVKLVDQAIADLDAYIVGWIHDEVQIASKSGTEDDVGHRLRRMAEEAGKSLSITIPIDADYVVGTNWSETH